MDQRLQRLTDWAAQKLNDLGTIVPDAFTLDPVSGDASFRRYFRARVDECSWIAMDAPPDREDSRPFVAIARAWRPLGIHVPEIVAADLDQGFLLLEDFGDQLLLGALTEVTADRLYGEALDILLRIQQSGDPDGYPLPAYSDGLLQNEMNLFRDWLCRELLQIEVPEDWFAPLREALISNAVEQPQVPVHRDYHARNLMTGIAGAPGVLDFQDAVRGPLTYDLVSLLRDCYLQWPEPRVRTWATAYCARVRHCGLTDAGDETFLRWFDRMGIQRHLKASGIFARLWLRDGKPGYLADIPRTLSHILVAGAADPLAAELCAWIRGPMRDAMRRHERLQDSVEAHLS